MFARFKASCVRFMDKFVEAMAACPMVDEFGSIYAPAVPYA